MRASKLRLLLGSPTLSLSRALKSVALLAGAATVVTTSTGCIEDTDCGICDPNKLVLESISGINYANEKIHVLMPDVTDAKYFTVDLEACETAFEDDPTADNIGRRGAAEWCKISPLVTATGLELIFNNLLDPTSVELVRKDPSNPNLFEVYDWKSQIVEVRGPITRYGGAFVAAETGIPDHVERLLNHTCIETITEGGTVFDAELLQMDPLVCDNFSGGVPFKMQVDGTTKSYRGLTDWRAGDSSCTTPDEGPDVCCSTCDFELGVNVWKYGENSEGDKARPAEGAIQCGVDADVFSAQGAVAGDPTVGGCAGFVTHVNRDDEVVSYTYDWGGESITESVPWYDKLRETYPGERPADQEHTPVHCDVDQDCADWGLTGTQCIGEVDGDPTEACSTDDPTCINKRCKAEWFVECVADNNTTGPDTGYCVDTRYSHEGAVECHESVDSFQVCANPDDPATCIDVPAGERLAFCDLIDPDNFYVADECCFGSDACDPVYDQNTRPIERFDRDNSLPEETGPCYCGPPGDQPDGCAEQIEQFCTSPHGSLVRHDGESNEGDYITKFVTKSGGMIYDPAVKGVEFRPGDLGNIQRTLVEQCAEARGQIGERNPQDGWVANESSFFENFEDFDRGMCSGQEYTIVFATSGEHVRDKVGNTLEGRAEYTFETPQFHVQPNSGFPTDNLHVGACDDFDIRVSNKYDMSPHNLNKLQLWQIEADGCDDVQDPDCWKPKHLVAGGEGCSEDPFEVSNGGGDVVPCLTVDVRDQDIGKVGVQINPVKYGPKLFNEGESDDFDRVSTGRYRLVVPGLGYDPTTGEYTRTIDSLDDLDPSNPDDLMAYRNSFHDVCVMPLVVAGSSGGEDFHYDFTIDEPKCRDDKDGDGVQVSCDNAPAVYNPDQDDSDQDNFGDVYDLCPVTPGSLNSSDSDKDGVGNDCDKCRDQAETYNEAADPALLPDARYWVRNNPQQVDTDQDGVGDACDNCPTMANCGTFGPASPHSVGTELPDVGQTCQTDNNMDLIGDACAGTMAAGAAGIVGFADADDFDQDGIANIDDICPRLQVEGTPCVADTDCPEFSVCEMNSGLCQHRDTDTDGVGNECDTCPFAANPMQTTNMGMQLDDDDGDYVGEACETNAQCAGIKDPRPIAFYEVAVDGFCCITQYPGDGVFVEDADGVSRCEGNCDPDGFAITADCTTDDLRADDRKEIRLTEAWDPDVHCRKLPNSLQPPQSYGYTELAPGCVDALAAAGRCDPGDPACDESMENKRLTIADGDPDTLWGQLCFLPQRDQDFDGVGDGCDKCEFNFDPFNEGYLDANGKFWPDSGKYCSGEYKIDEICQTEDDGGMDETGTESGG
jgi:hypothetical protein